MVKSGRQQQQQQQQVEVSSYVRDAYPFLHSLAKTRSVRKQHHLLRHATTQELLALIECALNIVKARFNITSRQRKRMLPYAEFIRRLSRLRSERGARRFVLQKGSGIGAHLLSALLTPIILMISSKLQQPQEKQQEEASKDGGSQ